jgi:hypothetical protein
MNAGRVGRLDRYQMAHSMWAVLESNTYLFVFGQRLTSPRQRVGMPHLNP